jgi:tRNA-splicing endonuclease subunit Sen2
LNFTELTSEEITAKRRAERKQFKLDRARAIAAAAAEAEAAFAEGRVVSPALTADGTRAIPSAATWKPQANVAEEMVAPSEAEVFEDEETLQDVEHLQLTLPEAFFLLWTLDCLTILDPNTVYRMGFSPH